jgi:NAD(P)-dependent dehydrogenase (short-subunit alcohol dehydrogenase family)
MEIMNQIAIVTGGGSGMGKETAMYLSEKGAKVAIFDLNEPAAKNVATKIHGLAVTCNVSDANSAQEALQFIKETWGVPRICINCAGIAPAKRLVGPEGPMPLEEFEKVISINLIGTFNMMRLVSAMIINSRSKIDQEDQGVIINTASVAAFEGQIGQTAYSASKGGICALTLPAARELAQFGIRVVTIAPGLILTPLFAGFSEEVQKNLASNVTYPKRLGKPSEFAKLAAHIIENSYLNGNIIRLDGGLRMPAK